MNNIYDKYRENKCFNSKENKKEKGYIYRKDYIKVYIIIMLLLFFLLLNKEENYSLDSLFNPKIDYDNSLTSLACSIEKYFEINPLHKTLPLIDKLLEEKQPENVILLLFDGLGTRVMNKYLDKNSFLMKNLKSEIYSVYPSSTAPCLKSIKTGLNPSEHGWLGYSIYLPQIKKIIELFSDTEKGTFKINQDFQKIKKEYYYNHKTITDLIKGNGKYLAYDFSNYPYNVDTNIDKCFQRILDSLKNKGKKYIFSFYLEPDNILHIQGPKSQKINETIQKINAKVEEYSKLILKHEKTMMIIIADHGHLMSIPEKISFSELNKYLKTNKIFIENRSPAFLVKPSCKKEFIKAFKKKFGKSFYLLSKKDIVKYKIYGEYSINNMHKFFKESSGDFMAITKDNTNKLLFGEGDHNLASFHGGYSDDEIFIPLIVISN